MIGRIRYDILKNSESTKKSFIFIFFYYIKIKYKKDIDC